MRASGLLACLLVLAATSAATASDADWPNLHLRTRLLNTEQLSKQRRRLLSDGDQRQQQQLEQQRLEAEERRHTAHAAWGALAAGSRQFLLAHRAGLTAGERAALVEHIEGAAGCTVAHYVPDHALLVVGPAGAEAALEAHPHVLWLGEPERSDKLDPHWQQVLVALQEAPSIRGLSANSTAAAVRAAQAALPAASQWDAAAGQLLVAATVAFPGLAAPAPHAASSAAAAAQPRLRRVTLQRAAQDTGAAAAADWGPLLQARFGARVKRTGPDAALVLAPAGRLAELLDWLAARPAVHWVAPAARLRLLNRQASTIIQSAKPAPRTGNQNLDPALHPLWAAGITGRGQVIGCGDSGLDAGHCFFSDPAFTELAFGVQDGLLTFDSPDHRKIRYYRAQSGDVADANGHGTHVVGTLLGLPAGYGLSDAEGAGEAGANIGMAPDAKVAFTDLGGGGSGNVIYTPSDLANSYFPYTYGAGAAIHSDSWGSETVYYDVLSEQVDLFAWENPDFLSVMAAGNDGQEDRLRASGRTGGDRTVTSPANAKNILSVGATQTTNQGMETPTRYVVWDATLSEGSYSSTFKVMQASFGGSVAGLAAGGKQYAMVVAQPPEGCSPLTNDPASVKGAIVLIQRGNCTFSEKALAAQDGGAAGVLIYDNVLQAYYTWASEPALASSITIPTMGTTRRLGISCVAAANSGKQVSLSFSRPQDPGSLPAYENLASYSSQGPTPDFRVKPDILAPGTITSAAAGTACGTATMAGTSMATPVVAGAAALVRQYFQDGFYPSGERVAANALQPSGALLKAVLLGGAATIDGYEADTGLPVDPPPSFRQGYGRVWLSNSLRLASVPSSPQLRVADRVPIEMGDTHEYCVRANGGPLAVTLVWTDLPARPSTGKALVNDLDLTVRAAGLNGIPLLGNGGSVDDPTRHDRENNVEQVALGSLPPGPVAITVGGANVFGSAGPQPYALVVHGDFSGELIKPGEPGSGEACTITVAAITAGPEGVTSDPTISFEFSTQSGSTNGIRFECRLGDAAGALSAPGVHRDWAECSSPATYDGLPDGGYQFSVRAAGEEQATVRSFTKDTQPPEVAFVNPQTQPSGATPDADARFEFGGSDATGLNFTCTLAATGTVPAQPPVLAGGAKADMAEVALGQPYPCTSPQLFHWLLPGSWSLQVVGRDAAGNAAPPLQAAWTVAFGQAGGLYTRFLSGPYGVQPKTAGPFEFTTLDSQGQEAAAPQGHECWLQPEGGAGAGAGGFAPCTSPAPLPADVADGRHVFRVRALGGAGAAPGAEATAPLVIDSAAPTVEFKAPPPAVTRAGNATLDFGASEEGCRFFCGLARADPGAAPPGLPAGDALEPCTPPKALTNLTDGLYVFAAYAEDSANNRGAPAAANFTVDSQAPAWDQLNFPSATSQPSVSVTFAASDVGSGVVNTTCRFRELALAAPTPQEAGPSAGGDASGDASAGGGSGGGRSGRANAEWEPCQSGQTWDGLPEGRYGLTLRAADGAGNVAQTDEFDVYVDATPPVVSVQGLPPLGELQPSSVTFNLSEMVGPGVPVDSVAAIASYQALLETVPDAATFTRLQTEWAGGSVTAAGSTTRGAGGRRLQQAPPDAAGQPTVLPSSAVGTWSNCSASCRYEGLGSGLYSLRVRAVDAAGNAGNETQPYPLEVDASIGTTPFPLWAIIACAVGGALALVAALWLLWTCCCRRKRGPSGGAASPHSHSGGAPAYAPGGGAPYAPGAAAGGAWGYSYAPSPHHANGHANGYANGHAPPPYAVNGSARFPSAPPPPVPASADPIEQQRLALEHYRAQAAAAQRQPSARRAPKPPPPAGAPSEEQQLAAALEASLQQARRPPSAAAVVPLDDEDAQLRAAIEASLREQQLQQQRRSWYG